MDNSLLERLSKIKSLVDRGVGGEKENAEVLLKRLLKKYNLTEEELLNDTVREHEFRFYGTFGKQLFDQIVYAVMGNVDIYQYQRKRNCKSRFVYCTESEALEINEMFDFYRHYLDEGLRNYYLAFVQIEKIFPPVEKCDPTIPSTKLSEEVIKLSAMMEKHERHLKLEEQSSSLN